MSEWQYVWMAVSSCVRIIDSVGKVLFFYELVQFPVQIFLNELVQFIVHNSTIWTKSSWFQKMNYFVLFRSFLSSNLKLLFVKLLFWRLSVQLSHLTSPRAKNSWSKSSQCVADTRHCELVDLLFSARKYGGRRIINGTDCLLLLLSQCERSLARSYYYRCTKIL